MTLMTEGEKRELAAEVVNDADITDEGYLVSKLVAASDNRINEGVALRLIRSELERHE